MEREICISKDIIKRFEEISKKLNDEYGVYAQLAQIMGKRWAYIAGKVINNPLYRIKKVKLGDNLGLILYFPDNEGIPEQKILKQFKLQI